MREGWKTTALGDITLPMQTCDPRKCPDKPFLYVDVSSVSNRKFEITDAVEIFGRDAPSRARRKIEEGDVIFATIRPTLRRIAVVPNWLHGEICSTGFFVFRPKAGIDGRFLYYHLFTKPFSDAVEALQSGASYPAVNDGQVRKQPVAFPPFPEQKRIVAILDEAFAGIDRVIANTEKNLANARELFESHLSAEFSENGEEWQELTLKDIAKDYGRGKSKHRPRNDPALYGGVYPFIQTGNVRNADHIISSFSQTYNDNGLAQSKLWPKGTVCVTIAANIAETGILDFDACFPDSVIGIVCDETKALNHFVEFMLRFVKVRIQARGKGSAQDNINLGTFETEFFKIPTVKMQDEIVQRLFKVRNVSTELSINFSAKIEKSNELKNSILQKAFAGQLTAEPDRLLAKAGA